MSKTPIVECISEDDKLYNVLYEILKELKTAETKHPSWPIDLIHAAAVVNEESGELMRASLQATYEKGSLFNVKKEAIQTATMGIRFLLHLDKMYPIPGIQIEGECFMNKEQIVIEPTDKKKDKEDKEVTVLQNLPEGYEQNPNLKVLLEQS